MTVPTPTRDEATDLADIVQAVAKHINRTRFKRLDSFLFKGAKDPDPSQVDEAYEIVEIVRRMMPARMLASAPAPASGVDARLIEKGKRLAEALEDQYGGIRIEDPEFGDYTVTSYLHEVAGTLAALAPYVDAVICYASTLDEHEGNRVAKLVRDAASISPAATPNHTANCCHCGRIIDTREKAEGGDDFGAEVSDGRWTCSPECWDAIVEPAATPVSEAGGELTDQQIKDAWKASMLSDTGGEFIPAFRAVIAADRAVRAKPVIGTLLTECWRELCERDDRTSPEEYPDMCLITQAELAEFMSRAALAKPASSPAGGEAVDDDTLSKTRQASAFDFVANWHEEQGRRFRSMSEDHPRIDEETCAKAADASRHHFGSAAALRIRAIDIRRANRPAKENEGHG